MNRFDEHRMSAHTVSGEISTTVETKSVNTSESTDTMFIAILHIDGFHPDDVIVQLAHGKIHVKGRQEHTYCNTNGTIKCQSKSFSRQLTLPKDVCLCSVNYYFRNDSTLVIEAPRHMHPITCQKVDECSEQLYNLTETEPCQAGQCRCIQHD